MDRSATTARWSLTRLQTFSSLKHHDFRYLWASTLFFSAGNWIQQVTLGWLIFDHTGNAFLVGALNGARSFPFLVVGPLSGVLVDRIDRRKLLLANQAFLGVLVLGFALLVSTDAVRVWHMFVFAILSGTGFAIQNPLRQAMIANVVPRAELPNAIALSSAAFNINRVLGPAAGGVLIAAFGPGLNFFIQAIFYILVAFMVLPIGAFHQVPSEKPGSTAFSDLREGVRYVAKEPTVLALVLIAMVPAFFIMPFTTGLMPVFAKDVLDTGPGGLGLLLAAFGAGGLTGAVALASMGNRKNFGAFQVAAGIGTGLALFAVSRSTSLSFAVPFLVAEGLTQMLFNAINTTHLQVIIPDAVRGRVLSIYMMNIGLAPLGAFVAGGLAQAYGAEDAMLAGAGVAILLVLLTSMAFRKALAAR